MNYQVETELDRTLDPRGREGIVGNRNDIVLARDFRDGFKIDQFEQRIAWCFDPNHARVLFDGRFELARIRKVDIGELKIGRATPDAIE